MLLSSNNTSCHSNLQRKVPKVVAQNRPEKCKPYVRKIYKIHPLHYIEYTEIVGTQTATLNNVLDVFGKLDDMANSIQVTDDLYVRHNTGSRVVELCLDGRDQYEHYSLDFGEQTNT